MTGLSKSALNFFIVPSFGVNSVVCLRSTAKTCAFVNFMLAYFGTTKPDFSELGKWAAAGDE